MKAGKTKPAKRKVIFLGFLISEKGIEVDPEKTDKIRNFPAPKNYKEVQQVLGFFLLLQEICTEFCKIS